VLQDLYRQKKKFKSYDIFIFECMNCSLFMMLHQKVCPYCSKKNIYYDETLNVGQQIEDDVTKILESFHKRLNMKNQAKEAGGDEHFSPQLGSKGEAMLSKRADQDVLDAE